MGNILPYKYPTGKHVFINDLSKTVHYPLKCTLYGQAAPLGSNWESMRHYGFESHHIDFPYTEPISNWINQYDVHINSGSPVFY